MAQEIHGMVEKRGAGLWLTHIFMIFGVLVIFFPIWLAFVASTVTQPEIVSPPMPLWPGDHMWENYSKALFSGVNVPVTTMLFNSGWQNCDLAAVRLCDCLLPLPGT
jgi:sn-glycerol 3-phosphate transport system permease protein